MSKIQHTPGPWDDCSKNATGETVRIFANSHYIGSIGNSDDTPEQTQANAHLIAAAPDLLAAIKAVLPTLDDATQDAWRKSKASEEWILVSKAYEADAAKARAAITKATEGQACQP